jgi:hypothetical protein
LDKYFEEKAEFVKLDDVENWIGERVIYDGDFLNASADIARHDPQKLSLLINRIVSKKDYSNLASEESIRFKTKMPIPEYKAPKKNQPDPPTEAQPT